MTISAMPSGFSELCERVGLALMMGQKVQFSLAYYLACYQIVYAGWSKEQAKTSIEHHLSKPMGVVIAAIKKFAPLDSVLAEKIRDFQKLRNWLVHEFDQEATPYLSRGDHIPEYLQKMSEIVNKAHAVMTDLNDVGEKMVPVGSNTSPQPTATCGG